MSPTQQGGSGLGLTGSGASTAPSVIINLAKPRELGRQEKLSLIELVRGDVTDVLNGTRAEVQYERSRHLLRLYLNNRLWKGDHYASPVRDGSVRLDPRFGSPGPYGPSSGPRGRRPSISSLNYYKGDGNKLVGVLGLPPNMRVNTYDNDNEQYAERARTATQLQTRLHKHLGFETLQPEVVQCLYERGNFFLHTAFVANAKKWGYTQVPIYEMRRVQLLGEHYLCPTCGAMNLAETIELETQGICPECSYPIPPEALQPPVHISSQEEIAREEYANGSVEMTMRDLYTTYTPYTITDFERTPWLVDEEDRLRGQLLHAFQDLRGMENEYSSGGNDINTDQQARELNRAAAYRYNAWATDQKQYWRFTRVWWTVDMIEMIDKKQVRDSLLRLYPDGVKLTFINDKLFDLENERLTDVWSGCKPGTGKYFYSQTLGSEHATVARPISDMGNIMVTLGEKSIPFWAYNPEMLDMRAMKDKPIDFEFIPVLADDPKKALWQSSPVEIPTPVPQLFETLVNAARQNDSLPEALWGGGDPEPTLGGQEMRRNQALQPHNVTWNNIRACFSRAMDNAIRQLAIYAPTDGTCFFSPRPGSIEKITIPGLKDLLDGGWYTYCDEQIPMNWGQKRAQFWQIVDKDPTILQQFDLGHPVNLKAFQEALGVSDLHVPKLADREKTLKIIQALMQQQPVQGIDQMTGQPILSPSIPPDDTDDLPTVWQTCADFLKLPEIVDMKIQSAGNPPPGILNVLAYARAVAQLQAPPAQPQDSSSGSAGAGSADGDPGQSASGPGNMQPGMSGPAANPALVESPSTPEELQAPSLQGV